MCADKVRKTRKIAQQPISLETSIGEEDDSHLGDFIEDKAMVSPSDAVINLNLKEQTASVLKTLTAREKKIIKMLFGLEDGSEHTIEEVGQVFALTSERSARSKPKRWASCAPPRARAASAPLPKAPREINSRPAPHSKREKRNCNLKNPSSR